MNSPPSFHGMVLSAGFGTRLLPLTDEIPKPLVPIGDQTLLGRSLAVLRENGASTLTVNTHHHAEQVAEFVGSLPFPVRISREKEILGTAGGIHQARDHFVEGPLILVNGDIVGDLPIQPLLAERSDGLCFAVTPQPVGEGTVGIGEGGRVVRLRGEVFGPEISSGDYMGVARLGRECLDSLPVQGCLVGDWALPQLRAGRLDAVRALSVDLEFEDVGTPGAYLSANLNWLGSRGWGPTQSYRAERVSVAPGVQLVASVVLHGARIEGEGQVIASLILPGATAHAPLSDCIVTPSGRVISVGSDQSS